MNTSTSLSNKQRMVRLLLWIITAIYAIALIPACIAAMFSSLALDGGGTADIWVIILVVASFPFTILGSVAGAWILYRRGRLGLALLATLLPIAHLAGSYLVPGIWSSL